MADKPAFWKGVSAGLLAGMTIAAAVRYLPLQKLITSSDEVDNSPTDRKHRQPASGLLAGNPAPETVNFFFRGDRLPRTQHKTSSSPVNSVVAFRRKDDRVSANTTVSLGGPQSRVDSTDHEDHIDLTKPVRVYPRNLDLGSAG